MELDGARRIDDWFEPTIGGSEVLFLQEARAGLHRWLVVEVLEGQADLVGTRGLEVADWEIFERLPMSIRSVGRVAQLDIARAAQQALALLFRAAHLIDRVFDDFDGVELIEGDSGFWQALGNALDEGRPHVDADFTDSHRLAAMRGQAIGRHGYGLGILALSCEQHPSLVDINEQRDLVMASPSRSLIEGNPGYVRDVDWTRAGST